MLIGILTILLLIAFACWEMLYRWFVYRRLQLHGILVQAHVTEIKREGRLVTQIGGANSTLQRIKYEDFLSAEWKDPLTQQVHLFRTKIPTNAQFHKGTPVTIQLNPNKPQEYRFYFSPHKRSPKTPLPQLDTIRDYQQGYQPSEQETPMQIEREEYEQPQASYPQQLPEQQSY